MARPADLVLKQSKLIELRRPYVYQPPLCLVTRNRTEGLYKYTIGSPSRSFNQKPEKVLMLLGAKGAGKSTLINGIANYVLGVEFNDNFRFKVVTDEGSGSQANSQTKNITAYTFYSTILDYNLTVIDTPGFGGTQVEEDKRIARQIKMFFAGQSREGIDVLNGIGLVTQASLARLTPTQKYIFDAVLLVFGRDVASNIFLLTTFADAGTPQVMEAIKAARIPFQQTFKFNNSALYCSTEGDGSSFNSMFWKMGTSSFSNFFVKFNRTETKSLTLTREVLKEREQLETLISQLQAQVKAGLNQLDAIQQEEEALKFHKMSIMENKNYTYHVTEQKIKKVDFPAGTNTTTCRKCNFTCHADCPYSDDRSKANCVAMRSGYCTICPNRCHWSDHSNVPYRIDHYTETVRKTYDAKKELYDKAKSGKQRVECLLAEKQQQLSTTENEVYYLIKQVQERNGRLRCIALQPNQMTETDYFKLLITTEETEKGPGWKERVQKYHVLIKEAELLKKMSHLDIKYLKDRGKLRSMWKSFK